MNTLQPELCPPPTAPEPTPPPQPQPDRATQFAAIMFSLALVDLIAFAGLIHRANKQVTIYERGVIEGTILLLWPVFIIEAIWQIARRDRKLSIWPVLLRALLVMLFPPYRIAMVDSNRRQIWLPWISWSHPGKHLETILDQRFGVPLLIFAMLVLPVLGAEYFWKDDVKNSAIFSLTLQICLAVIWLAFALDFLIKVEASGRPFQYAKTRWLDLAIVILPTLEFILSYWANFSPIARLMRTSQALAPTQLSRMGRLYRLRGLVMKGWHALLALELFARMFGDTPERKLTRLEKQILMEEAQVVELRLQAEDLRTRIAERKAAALGIANETEQPVRDGI